MSHTISLSVVLGMMFCFLIVYKRYRHEISSFYDLYLNSNVRFIILRSLSISFIGGVLLWVVLGGIFKPDTTTIIVIDGKLVSLKDTKGMSGTFFLGTGGIQDEFQYYGYEDLGGSKYKLKKFEQDVIVVEDLKKYQQPYFCTYHEITNPNAPAWKYENWIMGPFENDFIKRTEIHVQKGTILQNRALDLE